MPPSPRVRDAIANKLGQALLAADQDDPAMALARLQPQANRLDSDEAARRLARDGPKEVQHEAPLPVAVGLTPERHPTLWLAMNPAHTRCPVGTRSVGPCNGPPGPPGVRRVRQTSPNGQVRVLATNLDSAGFPAALFGDLHHLHHPRWRIKEAFKRQKHRLKLESVSGLSQQALIIDVAAKVRTQTTSAP